MKTILQEIREALADANEALTDARAVARLTIARLDNIIDIIDRHAEPVPKDPEAGNGIPNPSS
ncbi:MAG: hypothetical protein ACREF0_16515 [Acetobacteraceae bacterium]